MSSKNTQANNIYFYVATAIIVAAGYGLSLVAKTVYYERLTTIQLPLGDPILVLGGMYFAIVALAGILIAYFYNRFSLV